MIKSQREYAVTKKALAELVSSRETLASTTGEDLGRRAALSSIDAKLEDFRAEIADWEGLRAGGIQEIDVTDWDNLPKVLMRARIAKGLNQQSGLASKSSRSSGGRTRTTSTPSSSGS